MSNCTFSIAYLGPAVDAGAMPVKDIAPALLALGEIFDAANDEFNDEAARVEIYVNATSTGSFQIDLDLTQTIYQKFSSLLSSETVTTVYELKELLVAGGLGVIWLVKKLRGRAADKAEETDEGKLRLTVGSDTLLEINPKVYELYNNPRVRNALQSLIADPLRKDGIDVFQVRTGTDLSESVSKDEAEYFCGMPESDADVLTTNVLETAFVISTVAFKKGNKWRFYDGNATISAEIADEVFLRKVAAGEEVFANGDVLICRVRIQQTESRLSGVHSVYTIEKVLEHKRRPQQEPLDLSRENGSA